jgi:Ice-binding-like/Bacterial Ig-like domain
MRRYSAHTICFMSILLLLVATGCSDPDESGGNPGLTAPVAVSVAPLTGASGACINTIVAATFSKAMNPATINSTTFTLTGPSGTAEMGQVTYNVASNTAIFAPAAALTPNTLYTAAISTRARDVFGIGLANRLVWTFTTGAGACSGVGAPAVVSATPANGACPNTIATAVFNEAMDPTTLDTSTFTLTGPGTTPVNGAVTYDAASNGVTFTPASALVPSTTYTATITTGAADLLGQPLASDFVWTFTTAATLCQPPLPPNSVNPANGSTGICSNTVVAATFPQAMNPATINPATFTLTGPGVTPVAGTITHDVPNQMFVFTPTSTLALNTAFTATITTGAQDVAGNALASNFVWTFTTSAAACVPPPPPTVISVSPPDAALGICPDVVVTATFDEAMNPATITTTTLKLAGPGVTPVTGAVALDVTGRVASFTPASDLALNTVYTGTVTTGAQDLIGNGLASDFVWSFTTATQICQPPVPLGSVANFDAVAGSTVTNTGPTTIAGGDIGLSPGSAVTGFPPGSMVPPAVMHVTDPIAAQGQLDLTSAYNYAAGLPGGAVLPGDLSGLTFTPGLYKNSSTVILSAGNVTLDAQGDANAVFIFQIASTLTTLGSTQVVLAGGAQAKNIFWQVGSSATLGTNSIFKGTIMALQAVTLNTGASLQGRALARNAAVTFDSNTVTAP